ncbi:hypothetical protein QNK01_03785 [Desemzia incerta]|uniref:hypothetical protein n=1 Tax=Desemzia incerta TaxID=82801 RepID=UPI0024C2DD1C|nr:hypothetical protein [Desemzia incerta]WHZ32736.1 hypothetical protein QNK01_03785 [Desemzia incerta]
MKDVSSWERIGYGGKSTLEKEELLKPFTEEKYLIKYPRIPQIGVSWEDVTELIAAIIGQLLDLNMMDVEIVMRDKRRGSLLKNFIPTGVTNEEGGSMLSMLDSYQYFLECNLSGKELIKSGFEQMEQLVFWESIKKDFIEMNFFDILIGNQDRHPYNWMVLFHTPQEQVLSTIYDNGASLGFRFDDQKLMTYIKNENKLEKYMRDSTVKAGLFEKKKVKALDMAQYLCIYYPKESSAVIRQIKNFDFDKFHEIIDEHEILTEKQNQWLKLIVSFRRRKLLQWIGEEE